MKSRDGANRVVELEYFKARDCKMEGDKLMGTPTKLTRGLESLSMLNQDALDSCKIRQFLKHKCCPPQDQVPQIHEDQQEQNQNTETEEEELPTVEEDVQDLTPIEDIDPDINTVVWLERNRKEQQNQLHQGLDEQPHHHQMQDQSLVHQENGEQGHIDPIQNHPK